MGKFKNAALAQAPFSKSESATAKPQPTTLKSAEPFSRVVDRFAYALKAYTAERRKDGWWICRTPFSSAGEKPEWTGPFESIETACLAIARRLATEIADRHTRSIEAHKLKTTDPLYGLKSTTTLGTRKASSKSDTAY